jgi:hydroxymethylbilane synthase
VRLNLGHRITQRLDPKVFPYAVGQGALGMEVRTDGEDAQKLVMGVDHKPSRFRGLAERAMLRSLQGGCSSPIGTHSTFEPSSAGDASGALHLHGTVLDIEGSTEVSAEGSRDVGSDEDAEQLGMLVAKMLLDKGASNLLARPA